MTRTIEDCKTCDCFKSFYRNDIVLCGRTPDSLSLVNVQPSFYNEGIENGILIVHCLK